MCKQKPNTAFESFKVKALPCPSNTNNFILTEPEQDEGLALQNFTDLMVSAAAATVFEGLINLSDFSPF